MRFWQAVLCLINPQRDGCGFEYDPRHDEIVQEMRSQTVREIRAARHAIRQTREKRENRLEDIYLGINPDDGEGQCP